jgi:hypothetical protein
MMLHNFSRPEKLGAQFLYFPSEERKLLDLDKN